MLRSLLLLAVAAAPSLAQAPPNLLHLQAHLSDSAGVALSGPVTVEVRVYDVPVGGAPLWSETHAASALNGVVTLLLGQVAVLPSGLFDGTDRWIALRVGADAEMTPRRLVASVPFARRAATSAALDPGAALPANVITSAAVADGAITVSKIAASSVDSARIVDGAVASADLAAGAVTAAKLAASSVDGSKILNGSVGAADLASPLTGNGFGTPVVDVTATGGGGTALRGVATNSAIFGFGLAGESASTNGAGVRGLASSATGVNDGIYGESDSTSGRGVHGFADAGTGATRGVLGEADSTSGVGAHGIANAATGNTIGVLGEATSTSGVGTQGRATAATGFTYGVWGIADSSSGSGVFGSTTSATGSTRGVFGTVVSPSGTGVYGHSLSTDFSAAGSFGVAGEVESVSGAGVGGTANSDTGLVDGVRGRTASSSGFGVWGLATSSTGSAYGVVGESDSSLGRGILARATSGTGPTYGLWAECWSTAGRGLVGWATAASGVTNGVRGSVSSPSGYGVYSSGDLGGNGAKFFVQPHPTDASKEIRFVCLEGNESGTYFRGTSQLVGGRAEIAVPEEFRLVSEKAGLTVQVTAVGAPAALWIESQDLDRVVVRGTPDVEFHYFANGVRRGYSDLVAIRENHGWVPETRGVPFATQYPEAIRRILVENGTLNADYTPNEATAARLGWKLEAPDGGRPR
ncbi:MAG TPA: hypothetical protein VKE69_10080 [Planctomycetota bacterium]|nr:hypothetical protein [Planctomycetota bacterium]